MRRAQIRRIQHLKGAGNWHVGVITLLPGATLLTSATRRGL